MSNLYLYNSLRRKKEEFKPIKDKKAGLYSCGPTVYNYAHLGNLRAYIFADILKRVLRYNGYGVKHVMNITDVGHLTSDADTGEDKLETGARREGKSVLEIARFYEDAFKNDIRRINVIEPDIWARATEHIEEQINLIKEIEKNGYAYETKGAVYFDVVKFSQKYDYTALSGQSLEDKITASRCEVYVDPEKKNPADFALWLKRVGKYEKHILHWPSPWGEGFPGWHIECSAMGEKYLKGSFDIHTGGVDHIPVHHTNERAQNIAAYGHPIVNRWMHNEFLVISGGDKMAKSEGNFLTLDNALVKKNINPLAYRFAALQTHYRKPMEYSEEGIKNAEKGLAHFYNQVKELKTGDKRVGKINKEYAIKFLNAINDDLNTAKALAVAQDLLKSDLAAADKLATILDFDKVLGLGLAKARQEEKLPTTVEKLTKEREKAREKKDWKESDELRAKIEKLGYIVEDTPKGQRVFKKL